MFWLTCIVVGFIKAEDESGGVHVSCNNGNLPEMKIRLSKEYYEANLASYPDKFDLIDDNYEKTIPQEDLTPNWVDTECQFVR